jgi:hypothetical protein
MKTHHCVSIMIAAVLIALIAACAPAPYQAVPSDQVKEAAANVGLKICKSEPLKTQVPGSTGGSAYVLSTDCSDTTPGNNLIVVAESFESAEARDTAIRNYSDTTIGRAAQKNGFVTLGNYLVVPIGPRDEAVFDLLFRQLRQLGAQ